MSRSVENRKSKVRRVQGDQREQERQFVDSVMEAWHSDKKGERYLLSVDLFVLGTLRNVLCYEVQGRTFGGRIAHEIFLGVNGPIAAVARLGQSPPGSVTRAPARLGRWAWKNRAIPLLADLPKIPYTPRTARIFAKCLGSEAASHNCLRGKEDHSLIRSLKGIRSLRRYSPKLVSPMIRLLPPRYAQREKLIEAAEEIVLAGHVARVFVHYMALGQAMGGEPGRLESELKQGSLIHSRMVRCIDLGRRVRELVHQLKLHREFRFQGSLWRLARKRPGSKDPMRKSKDEAGFLLLDVLRVAGLHSKGETQLKTDRIHEDIFFQVAALEDPSLLEASRTRHRSARNRVRNAYRRYLEETGR